MHPEATPDVPASALHSTDSVVPESDAPAPRPWCPDGTQAEVVAIGDRIAELSARIQAATWELLSLIRQFDERYGWAGCTSCAEWLGWRTGLAPGAAREHVRVARALADLPKLSDAMRRGKVSYSKMRAVTRVATPETEDDLLNVALSGTAAHVEKIVRAWRRVDRLAEQAEDRRRHETRSLRTWVDEDGMLVVRGRLSPEVGAVVRRALEAACDQARGADATAAEADGDALPGAAGPSLAQRQADALGMIAECALSGGLDRGTAGDRYQVVVHVDADALSEALDAPAGTSATAAAGSEPRDGGHASAGSPAAASGSERADGDTHGSEGNPAAAYASRGRGNCSGVPAGTSATASFAPERRDQEAGAGAIRPAQRRGPSGRSPEPCPRQRSAASVPAVGGQTLLDEAGGHPHLGGDGTAAGLRRGDGQNTARRPPRDPRRRPPDAHHLAGPAPGAERPRPSVSVSGMPEPALRWSPSGALGPWGRNDPRQPGAVVPPSPPGGARGRVPRHPECARRRPFLPAGRSSAAGSAGAAELDGQAAGAGTRAARAGGHRYRSRHPHTRLARRATGSGLGDPPIVASAPARGGDRRAGARPPLTAGAGVTRTLRQRIRRADPLTAGAGGDRVGQVFALNAIPPAA